MPQVLHDAPAAVLVIDLDAPAGRLRQRRGDRLDRRSACAAGRRRRVERRRGPDRPRRPADERDDARRCRSSRGGVPVAGEPVAVPDSARRGSTAQPRERQAAEGRLLWVTGFPLSDAVTPTSAGRSSRWSCSCSSRAPSGRPAAAGSCCATARWSPRRCRSPSPTRALTDDPLVWVNPSFTRLTGYRLDEVVGRNCRLPAGPQHRPGGDPADRPRAGRGAADHRGAAQLPARRHRVLEPGVDLPGDRRRGQRRQLRRASRPTSPSA